MEKQEKIEILTKYFGSPIRRKDEYLFSCPVCKHHKKKLSVNFEKNKFKCWVCHYSGKTLKKLVFEHIGPHVDWEDAKLRISLSSFEDVILGNFALKNKNQIHNVFPESFIPLTTNEDLKLKEQALQYLSERGIGREDIIKWRMGFDNDGDLYGRIIIPSFDDKGMCNFFVARSFIGSKYKYWISDTPKKEIIFNEVDIDWSQPIVLVEGAFDAVVAGPNSIPLLGTSLEKRDNRIFTKILEHKPIVYLALDNEKEAIRSSMHIAQLLYSQMIEVYIIDIAGYKDPGSMTKEEFQKRKSEAIRFSFHSLFKKLLLNEE